SHPPQYVVVLPPYRPAGRRFFRASTRRRLCWFACVVLFLAAASAAYVFWPSDPELLISDLKLDRLGFHTKPVISLDVTLDLTIQVRNRDFYSIEYDSLVVAIEYRGRRLGFATSGGGRIRARGSSYVNATLDLDAVEMLTDAVSLLEDFARGAIEFDTVSEIHGKIALFALQLPVKAKVSCEATVNTKSQIVTSQNCYPEV
ncbi:hypothetical protein M569_11397, partial [Genlisea aurea]